MKRMVLILLLLFAVGTVYSQGLDTVWTYNLQPDYLKNAVFSPDEQFVFATHYDYNFPEKLRLSKFEKASGKFLWKTDSIMGIKQFSEDGKYFYTYDLKKYSYPEFELIDQTHIDKEIKFSVWELAINEKFNSLIVVNDRRFKDPPFYNRNYDSSLVFINCSNMKMENIISHKDTSTWLKNIAISPTKPQFITASSEGRRYIFDLWDLTTKSYIKNISYYDKMEYYDKPIIHYSPDGKLLGILTDSLRIYDTEKYDWVYTFPILWPRYFNFNYSGDGIMIITQDDIKWMQYFDLNSKKLLFYNSYIYSRSFLLENQQRNILTTRSFSILCLMKRNETGVTLGDSNKILFHLEKNNLKIISRDIIDPGYKLSVSNNLGKLIIPTNISTTENIMNIDVSTLIDGAYIIKLIIGTEEFTYKFIIVR